MSETTKAVQKTDKGGKPLTNYDTIKQTLMRNKITLESMLPPTMPADRFLRVVIASISKTPKLQECTPNSVLMAVLRAAEVGVIPTGVGNRSWLIPRKRKIKENGREVWIMEANFQLGYGGRIDIAYRNPAVAAIWAKAVYENDVWDYEEGLTPRLRHIPAESERGKLIRVYAICRLKSGEAVAEVLTLEDVEKARAASSSPDNGPWVTHYDAMARKTAINAIAKYLPSDPFMDAALAEIDHEERAGSETKSASAGSSLVSLLGSKTSEPAAEPEDEPLATPEQIDRFTALVDAAGLTAAQAAAKLGTGLDGKQVDYSGVTSTAIEEAIAELTTASQS